jgi:endonuclease-3 related protein
MYGAMTTERKLLNIFQTLLGSFGKRNWWPGDTELEIIIGAILTQNTSWKNVERAIFNMKNKDILNINALESINSKELGEIIRPSGFYKQKSERIKRVIHVIYDDFNGSIDNLKNYGTDYLRTLMLGIHGIGPETADCILLYALNRPVFVIDTYTKRFLQNHRLYNGVGKYDEIQQFFMGNLPLDTYLFNEFHALIVCLCQTHCKKVPECDVCPLNTKRAFAYS